jgi:hypothetical protein
MRQAGSPSGDVVVAVALGGQGHYFLFPGGEAGEDVVLREVAARFGGGEEAVMSARLTRGRPGGTIECDPATAAQARR